MSCPCRRSAGLVLALNKAQEVLLVDRSTRTGLSLPGGSARAGEAPNEAAARCFMMDTGLVIDVWEMLAGDFVYEDTYPEGFNVVFSGGVLTDRQVARIDTSNPQSRISGHQFVAMAELHLHVAPHPLARIRQAWTALQAGKGLPLLVMGEPVG
ncbi:NUDIX domain-containing protein [Kitasatospora sp. NPDC056138]|uniref:NUDIX domain-containing protein n=1 Tax=Kitasatospora sp. NPDC056138 TaxID=3345724 RepID=UPI0035D915E9